MHTYTEEPKSPETAQEPTHMSPDIPIGVGPLPTAISHCPRTMSQLPACPGSSHSPPQSHTAVVGQNCMQGGDSTAVSGVPPHWSTEGPGRQGPSGSSFHRADWPEGNPNGTKLVGRERGVMCTLTISATPCRHWPAEPPGDGAPWSMRFHRP